MPDSCHLYIFRSLDSAQKFAETFSIPQAFEGYEALAKCADVDIVYVGTIHPTHLEIVQAMIEAGKPVLCEKSMAMNLKEAKQMVQLARAKGVFLMEAIWSRFMPSYLKMADLIKSGAIGEVKLVNVTMGFDGRNVARVNQKALGGGSMLDLGVYCIHLINIAYDWKDFDKVEASGELGGEDGVDISVNAVVRMKNGGAAVFATSVACPMPNVGYIIGTKGQIVIEYPYHSPTKIRLIDANQQEVETIDFPVNNEVVTNTHYHFPNSGNLHYEAQHVRECLLKGLKESPKLPLDESLMIAEVVEQCRKKTGATYTQD